MTFESSSSLKLISTFKPMNNTFLFRAQIIKKKPAIVQSENLQQMQQSYFKTPSTEFIGVIHDPCAHDALKTIFFCVKSFRMIVFTCR